MRIESLNAFEAIDFPKHNSLSLAEEVSSFESWNMPEISLNLKNAELPYAAKSSLERHFTISDNGTPVFTQKDSALKPEEFILERNEDSVRSDRIFLLCYDILRNEVLRWRNSGIAMVFLL